VIEDFDAHESRRKATMAQSSFHFDEIGHSLDQSWIVRAEFNPSTLIILLYGHIR
jgi:hypothetical protein